jgi:uncharacterized protein (DUF58 family)
VSDPFGLARLSRRIDAVAELAVYPPVVALSAMPPATGRDTASRSERPALTTPHGEDFYTLREYQVGDDLRKVHWRSTARRGRLMIRQEELPWHARGTVMLDVREAALGPAGTTAFEAAVIAAASAAQYFANRGEFCRFLTTEGTDLPFGFGLDHLRAMLDRLAVIEEGRHDLFNQTLASLRRGTSANGALVFCGGLLSDDEASRFSSLRSRYSPLVAVRYPPSAGEVGRETSREATVDQMLRSNGVLVVRAGADGLTSAWDQVMGMARRARGMKSQMSEPAGAGRWLR